MTDDKDMERHNGHRFYTKTGVLVRSNEDLRARDDDIVYHKNKSTMDTYYDIFTRFFPSSIFEIGVREGGSLVLWNEIFPQANVVGIDIDMSLISESAGNYGINVFHCDSTNVEHVTMIIEVELGGEVNMIVDDGSHTLENIVHNLKNYWKFVSFGGIYVIEDYKVLHQIHIDVLSGDIEKIKPKRVEIYHNMIVLYK